MSISTPASGIKRRAFIFTAMSFLLVIPAVLLAASILHMEKTGTDISSISISSNRVSENGESIATDMRNIIEEVASSSTQHATTLAIELSFSSNRSIPSYAAPYFSESERAFLPGKSIEFIRDIAITGVHEGKSSDFNGMNSQIEQALSNYSAFTGLNITLVNPSGNSCIPGGTCDVFNSNNVEIVPVPYGMYTLIKGDWKFHVDNINTKWEINLPAKYSLKFNSSGTITTTDYMLKSYTSVVGLQDPLIWWVLSRWSTSYTEGKVKESAPGLTTWPIVRSPVEPDSREGNKVVNQSNTSESFLNAFGNDIISHRYHLSKYGPTFFDMLEARWWLSNYYRSLTPLTQNNEPVNVGLEVFITNDPLKLETNVNGTRYSTLYPYYFSSFFARGNYSSYIEDTPPYNNPFGYSWGNLHNQSFAPPSLIWNGTVFKTIPAGKWNSSALSDVYIVAPSKEPAYNFLSGHDIYIDRYNVSGYDNETVNTVLRYNLTWALQ